jgi:hypothetical protein
MITDGYPDLEWSTGQLPVGEAWSPLSYGGARYIVRDLGVTGLERYLGAVSWLAPLTGSLGAVVGASLAGFAAWRTNNSHMAADIQARWDAALLERSTDFVTAVRSLHHHAERRALHR